MIGLIDSSCANEGYEFVYLGEADECTGCSLRMPCHHNLEKGRRYIVTEIKGINHPCPLFDEVLVCEVKEVGIDAAINPGSAFEGASVSFENLKCKNTLCSYSIYCMPEGLKDGDRCTIESVKAKIKCPEKGNLTLATLKRI